MNITVFSRPDARQVVDMDAGDVISLCHNIDNIDKHPKYLVTDERDEDSVTLVDIETGTLREEFGDTACVHLLQHEPASFTVKYLIPDKSEVSNA